VKRVLPILWLLLLAGIADTASASSWKDVARWAAFDPGAHGVGVAPDGYAGGTFDGRYVYFAPSFNGSTEAMRYDTQGGFELASSWETFDPGFTGGYVGACFDGRYVYYAPWAQATFAANGEVLRFDTTGSFSDSGSWSTFDVPANGVGTFPAGFWGIRCDEDGFVYFAPEYTGEVLRYDRSQPFGDAASWQAFDVAANGVGDDPAGYKGIGSDGQNIYFVPYWNPNNGPTTGSHGQMLVYDKSGPFDSASSWSAYTPHDDGVGAIGKGYEGAVFDGRYMYFVPSYAGWGTDFYHGEVMRYDTTLPFAMGSSWLAYDPGNTGGVGLDPDGYNEGLFDGRYIYFVPTNHGDPDGPHGEVLRYDTTGGFTTASSWDTFDPGSNGVGTDPDGYSGFVFDGRYMYFVPDRNEGQNPHGEVLRFEVATSVPLMGGWGSVLMALAIAGPGAAAAAGLRTRRGTG